MQLYVYPALYALFVWWFSTGVIIYLDGLPRHTFRWTLLGATVLTVAAFWGVLHSRDDTTVYGAYHAFTCGMLVWAWPEVTFYLGFITGIRRDPCPEGCRGPRHFGHAVQANLYHELLTIGFAVALVAITWDSPNRFALWTYLLMWIMTLSAKLNVLFGVRNLNEEFLPEHLQFLKSFFTKKPINPFFPVAITCSTAFGTALYWWVYTAPTAFEAIGLSLLAFQMALAVLEHWVLVIPLPANLWGWSLSSHKQAQNGEVAPVEELAGPAVPPPKPFLKPTAGAARLTSD